MRPFSATRPPAAPAWRSWRSRSTWPWASTQAGGRSNDRRWWRCPMPRDVPRPAGPSVSGRGTSYCGREMMAATDMRIVPILAAAAVFFSPAGSLAADAAPTGDVTVPADHGLTTTLPDGVTVTFEAGAVARWQGAGKLASETAKWTRGFHLEITEGEIDVTVPSGGKEPHAFLVTTRAGTVTEWRGRMHLTVHGDTTSLSVYEGSLVVGSNRQSFHVSDPTALVLHKSAEADKAHTLPAVPAWDASAGPPSFAVVAEGTPSGVGAAWTPVAGAASYRLLLASDQ